MWGIPERFQLESDCTKMTRFDCTIESKEKSDLRNPIPHYTIFGVSK